ncbi:hypothetical protein SteCoe_11269 [Stentor coeruleus]|uniref:Uncharacterized protein n=1 Tax=Stentor coeruleus TaxID=5963 RepID=A0A1R2CDM9_9CILI|nr:hypothetical protein SteCoe_11269 [Stentor coeruleus]
MSGIAEICDDVDEEENCGSSNSKAIPLESTEKEYDPEEELKELEKRISGFQFRYNKYFGTMLDSEISSESRREFEAVNLHNIENLKLHFLIFFTKNNIIQGGTPFDQTPYGRKNI